MAHFWHDLGKAFSLRAVIMVLGDKLRAASIVEVAFSFDKSCIRLKLTVLVRYTNMNLCIGGIYNERKVSRVLF